MRKQIVIFFSVLFLSIGCSDEMQLQQSVFFEDRDNPGLPRYSELGYNTFGAYYDRQVFVSSEIVPIKVVYTGGVTSFTFSGEIGSREVGYEEMSIAITLDDFAAEEYSDLIDLQDMELDLTDANYTIRVKNESIDEEIQILNGTFHFKRAQSLIVDKQQIGVVLSGIFEFQALIDGEPVAVSNGRFDTTVGDDNFFSF